MSSTDADARSGGCGGGGPTPSDPLRGTPPPPLEASDALHEKVRRFIAGQGEGFEELALEVAQYQVDNVEPVARSTRARLGGARALSVDQVPALPTDVFRLRRVAAHPPDQDQRVFRTSGTTSANAGGRGAHALRTLATYEAAAMTHAAALLWPDSAPRAFIVLAPSASALPDSSLSFMIDLFIERLGVRARHVVDPSAGLDVAALRSALAEERERGEVVAVMGTAFAYVHMLDAFGAERFVLPEKSRVMLTGGFKGKAREVPEAELRSGLTSALGVEPRFVIGEYGMTELSSQLYEPRVIGGAIADATYRPPRWMRVDAVDPETLAILPRGREGIARIVDLANVDSSLVVQTQDRVVVSDNGDVRLLGRLPGAPPRGCSIAMDEILGR